MSNDIFKRGDVGVKPRTPGTHRPDYTKPAPKKYTTLQLETLGCPSCGAKIEQAVSKVEGIWEVEVLFNSSMVKLHALDADSILAAATVVEKLGYPVLEIDGREVIRKKPKRKGFFARFKK